MKQSLFRRGRYWQAKLQLPGWPREKRVSLHTSDKRTAQAKLVSLLQEAEKEAAGLLPPRSVRVATSRTFLEHVEAFLADLQAREKAPATIRTYGSMLRRLSAACGWVRLGDVSPASFCGWRKECGLHPETANDFLSALSRFFNWLNRQRIVRENPVEHVERADTRAVAREYRRALTAAEVAALLESAPSPRRVVYRMVLETGLRRCELMALRWADFALPTGPEREPKAPPGDRGTEPGSGTGQLVEAGGLGLSGSVRVPASVSKNRRTAILRLGPALVAELLAIRPQDAASFHFVFRGLVPRLPTFRKDLSRAGLVFVDAAGRRVDLHSLRKTFGTALVLTGAQPRVVMEAMRHSDLKLTMKTYMDARQLEGPVEAAVKLLPWNQSLPTDGAEKVLPKTLPNLLPNPARSVS